MAYESQEGDFIINDNGGKKKTHEDPDGKGNFLYAGTKYKTLKIYVNSEKKTDKQPDFKGNVDINGDKCEISLWSQNDKKTQNHPDLTGYIVVGGMQYRMGAWKNSGKFGVFWAGKTSGSDNKPARWGADGNGKPVESRQNVSGGGMSSASVPAPSGGMGSSQGQSSGSSNSSIDDFDDSDIPF